MNILN